MNKSRYTRLSIFLLFFMTALAPLLSYGRSTIALTEGASVVGDILREQPDGVIVDIGFTLIDIPRENIVEIIHTDEAAAVDKRDTDDLFYINDTAMLLPVNELVEQSGEAVVLIKTNVGLGSGFIIHSDGYVVTNDHVIAGEHQISITVFEQGDKGMAKVQFDHVKIIATSPEQDLALLKIETELDYIFKTVPLGESRDLRPGQSVFAIGSPLGLERTVSEGIVSLRNRLVDGRIYIQQTAEISPGNSGGPLFNLKGEIIGVNNMKVVATGAEGLGFAIPSNVLKAFLRNRDAFVFDPKNPGSGFRYNSPPIHVNDDE